MKRNGGFTGFSKKMAFALSICLILSNIPGYNLVVYAAEGVSVDDCLEGTVSQEILPYETDDLYNIDQNETEPNTTIQQISKSDASGEEFPASFDEEEQFEGAATLEMDTFNAEKYVWGDYETIKDDEAQTLKLMDYNGTENSIIVPATATIDGIEYRVVPLSRVWKNRYLTSISFAEGFKAPEDCSDLFDECAQLESIDLTNFDTSNVTNMNRMFSRCSSLTSLVLSGFNTSKVTTMAGMFSGNSSLESLDVSGFNTSNVTNMGGMFSGCSSLESLNLSSFNTSNVTNMGSMFYKCSSLASLDLSGFNTSNTTDMGAMFSGCSSLTSLDLSKFNTSNITKMPSMFRDCSGLTNLDLSNFDTSNVTNTGYMFSGCSSLTSLGLSSFDTSNITDMSSMFSGCVRLTSLDLNKFNTSKVRDMGAMFSGCSSLTSLDLSMFNTSNVTEMANPAHKAPNVTGMASMFKGCSSLTSLDLRGFDTSNVKHMGYMFEDCSSLKNIDLRTFDTSKVTTMDGMFRGCSGLTSLDLSGFDTSKATDMHDMFESCSSLTSLDLSGFDTSKVTNMGWMFSGCSSLTSLDLSGFETSNITDMRWMFRKCSSLTSLDVSSFDTSKVTDMSEMFESCSSLTSLDISSFDTTCIKNGSMLGDTERLTSIKTPKTTGAKEIYLWGKYSNIEEGYNNIEAIPANMTKSILLTRSKDSVIENTGSGLDPVPVIKSNTIYLVKGQSFTMGGTGWSTNASTVAKVAPNTGKITAVKKGNAMLTDGEGNTYTAIVAEPSFTQDSKNTKILVGESANLIFNINSPFAVSDVNYPVTWVSSNGKIVSVKNGKVSAIAKGSAKVYAYVGGKAYSASVKVTDTYAAPKKQTEKEISLEMGLFQSVTLKYDTSVFKVNGAKWSGDDMETTVKNSTGQPDGGYKNSIISITKYGKITAIGEGNTTIIGNDGTNEVTVTIAVNPAVGKKVAYITKGKTETLKYAFVNNSKSIWTSNDTSIVTVEKGKVKAIKCGSTTVTCSYNGFLFETLVNVEDPEFVTDDILKKNGSKYEMTLNTGDIYRLNLNNVYQTVNYKSSKTENAFIDETGTIYARKAGKANITSNINGKTYKIQVTVK